MSTQERVTLHIKQGAKWEAGFHVMDDNKQPFPLTGYTAQMDIRERAGGELLATLSTANEKLTINEAGGIVEAMLTHAETSLLPVMTAEYDVFIQSASGIRHCIAEGDIEIRAKITEWAE